MAGFYIKKVIAKSAAKGDASVSFGKGLTIIQGRSDSGKTCVANCIDFIFGGSVDKPFKEKGKILTKEINKKEKEIKNELLHLRMVRIVNDEFLSKKFLTSEKTFFDRKIKCE